MRSNTLARPNTRNRYAYILMIQASIGYGFEDVTCYDTNERKDALADLDQYRRSGDGMTYRMITRRVPMADYLTGRF